MRGFHFNTNNAANAVDHALAVARTGTCQGGEKAVGVVGPAFSSMALITGAMAGLYQIPQVSASATSITLSDKNTYPYFLRTTPADDNAAEALVMVVQQFEWSRVCLIATNDEYGEKGSNTFRIKAAEANIVVDTSVLLPLAPLTPTGVAMNNTEKAEAFKALLAALTPKGQGKFERCSINICLMNGQLAPLVQALRDMGRTGGDFLYLHADTTVRDWKDPQMTAVGALRPNEPPLVLDGDGWLGVVPTAGDNTMPERRNLDERWRALTNQSSRSINNEWFDDGDGIATTPSTVYAYDAVLAYAKAASQLILANQTLTGANLLAELYKVNIDGASGSLFFEAKTGNRQGVPFNVTNFKVLNKTTPNAAGGATPTVAVVSKTGLNSSKFEYIVETNQLVWPSGLAGPSNRPRDTAIKEVRVTNATRWALGVMAVIGMVLCVVLSGLVHLYRERPVIKMSSPVFIHLIILGCFLVFLNVIVYGVETDAACMARPWLHSLSFSLVFGSLFVKSHRTDRIFNTMSTSTKGLRNQDLLVLLMGIMAVDVVILVTWTAGWPLRRVAWSESVPGLLTKGITCGGPHSLIFSVIIIATKAFILVWGIVLAIKIKDVKLKDMNEVKVMSVTMYNIGIFSVIVLLVYFFIQSRSSAVGIHILVNVSEIICFYGVLGLFVGYKLYLIIVKKVTSLGEKEDPNGVLRRRGNTIERDRVGSTVPVGGARAAPVSMPPPSLAQPPPQHQLQVKAPPSATELTREVESAKSSIIALEAKNKALEARLSSEIRAKEEALRSLASLREEFETYRAKVEEQAKQAVDPGVVEVEVGGGSDDGGGGRRARGSANNERLPTPAARPLRFGAERGPIEFIQAGPPGDDGIVSSESSDSVNGSIGKFSRPEGLPALQKITDDPR